MEISPIPSGMKVENLSLISFNGLSIPSNIFFNKPGPNFNESGLLV